MNDSGGDSSPPPGYLEAWFLLNCIKPNSSMSVQKRDVLSKIQDLAWKTSHKGIRSC